MQDSTNEEYEALLQTFSFELDQSTYRRAYSRMVDVLSAHGTFSEGGIGAGADFSSEDHSREGALSPISFVSENDELLDDESKVAAMLADLQSVIREEGGSWAYQMDALGAYILVTADESYELFEL